MSKQLFITGADPTAWTTIDGARLSEMVNRSTIASDMGIVITTTDNPDGSPNTPDTTTYPELKRFIWRRISITSAVTLYVWSDGANAWNTTASAAIGYQSIVTDNIALGAIGPNQISTVNGSQVIGALSASASANLLTTATAFTGALTGTYSTLALADSAVSTSGKVANGVIPAGKLNYSESNLKATPVIADNLVFFDSAAANVGVISSINAVGAAILAGVGHYTTTIAAPTFAANTWKQLLAPTAHGLTGPLRGQLIYKCVITDSATGYTAGDMIVAPTNTSGFQLFTLQFSATQVWVNFLGITSIAIPKKSEGSSTTITQANWSIIVQLYNY